MSQRYLLVAHEHNSSRKLGIVVKIPHMLSPSSGNDNTEFDHFDEKI